MQDHEPSSLIPLHDGMVISFINYEIRVNLERKDADEVTREDQQIQERQQTMHDAAAAQTAYLAGTMTGTMAAQAPVQVVEEDVKQAEEKEAEKAPKRQ